MFLKAEAPCGSFCLRIRDKSSVDSYTLVDGGGDVEGSGWVGVVMTLQDVHIHRFRGELKKCEGRTEKLDAVY